ncbi:MAG: hypothetical protein H7Y16_00720 [Candidatus Parcubacteria bacterium]|nr:hypothetical protein [Burkholderiales bacterium]
MRACLAVAGLLAVFATVGSAQAQPEPGWEAARRAILADYAKQQPGDKVQEVSGPDQREAILIAVRYHGTVLVQRADGSRSRDRVRVEYRLVGSRWELEKVQVYDSQALADLQPPSAQEAQKILLAAWQGAKCEAFDGLAVAIDGEPRYQLETTADRASAKRWYVYNVKVSARGNGKFRLSEDGVAYVNSAQNMLLWNPAQKSWSVEARQLRRTGFAKSR